MAAHPDPRSLESLPLLPAGEGDRHFDYCLESYRPRRPIAGKVRSENLLWQSLLTGDALESLRPPLEAIQQRVGRDLTVWGVKWDGERLWWELYFYDPQKESPDATITAVSEALSPWLRVVPQVPETVPYMMFSFDLWPDTCKAGQVSELNLYLTGEREHRGRSYTVRDARFEFQNVYRFLEPKAHIDELLPLLQSSVFVDYSRPVTLSRVLVPELFACKKVCVAKKRTCDAIYFSGIAIDQLLWFLKRFAYPMPIVDFVTQHQARLEHLFFDVGIDYAMDPTSGEVAFLKSSYYGTL